MMLDTFHFHFNLLHSYLLAARLYPLEKYLNVLITNIQMENNFIVWQTLKNIVLLHFKCNFVFFF